MTEPAPQPKCLACGGQYLTPPLDVGASGYGVGVKIPPAGTGFMDSGTTAELKARICASCGYVMAFISGDSLGWLHYKWKEIQWPTE